MFSQDNNIITKGLAGLCLLLAAGLVYSLGPQLGLPFGPSTTTSSSTKVVSKQQAKEAALAYINKQVLKGQATAKIPGKVVEKQGLYQFNVEVGSQMLTSYMTKDGALLFPQAFDLTESKSPESKSPKSKSPESKTQKVVGNFSVKPQAEVCTEQGKPIVYFFGSTSCPHCQWEHPVFEEAIKPFTDYIALHNNMDSQKDRDVFQEFSTGGIPTLVLGCKYYRVGAGENLGKEKEKQALTTLLCDITDNQPTNVCK